MVVMRRATLEDRPILESWDAADDVAQWAGSDGPWDWEHELEPQGDEQQIFLAHVDDAAVGVLQLLDAAREPSAYWGEGTPEHTWAVDMWIGEARHRGRGIGTEMMNWALTRAFEDLGAHRVLVDPLIHNAAAIRFYRRCGFDEIGPRRFGEDECLVLGIDRERWRPLHAGSRT